MQPDSVSGRAGRGGKASDGKNRILDITQVKLHQRVLFFVGTKSMVEDAERFIAENPDK